MSLLPGDLTCKELVELVTSYYEGALTVDERDRFEQHAGRCRGCAAHLTQMRATIAITGRLLEEDVAPDAGEALRQAFRGWRIQAAGA
jgi:anti-sigma factor RsiW